MFPQFSLDEVFANVWTSGCLTRSHRQALMSALLHNGLSLEERNLIDRLVYAVRRGWLRLSE